MAIDIKTEAPPRFIDKAWLRDRLADQDERTGFKVDRTVTPQQVRAMMLADGIRPEDNAFSTEIIRLRYEDSGEDE